MIIRKRLEIPLDFRSSLPIYLQIVQGVQNLVASGELHQGDQLPTVRQLAEELKINFNTVSRAYRLLDEAGLISTQRGRGTYVWEEPTEETVDRLRVESLEELTRQYLQDAARLGFDHDQASAYLNEFIRRGPLTAAPEISDNEENHG